MIVLYIFNEEKICQMMNVTEKMKKNQDHMCNTQVKI